MVSLNNWKKNKLIHLYEEILSKFAFGYEAFSRAGPTVVLQEW